MSTQTTAASSVPGSARNKLEHVGGQAVGSDPESSGTTHPLRTVWRQRVQEWHPGWRERTYFVPPIHMYSTDHDVVQVAGQDVRVPKPPVSQPPRGPLSALQETHVVDDLTQQRILHCLRKLSEEHNDVMFVISGLKLEDYLTAIGHEAATEILPRPLNLKAQQLNRGDFDFLIIHRLYGILACEVKAVGARFSFPTLTVTPVEESTIGKRVQRMIKQLTKYDVVLNHAVSDMTRQPRIRLAPMFPNVSTAQLQTVLANHPQLSHDLCQCLGTRRNTDPVSLFVTSDHLSDIATPHDVTSDVIQQLELWWEARMTGEGVDPSMSDDTYLELLARFSGPASTVRVFCSVKPRLHKDVVRTEGEAVSETGRRFTQIMLTPHQVAVHHMGEPLVFLTGPPGVGKSMMLLLRALDWVRGGEEVQIVSTWDCSLAVSHYIVHQLKETEPAAAQNVKLHHFDLDDGGQQEADRAVKTLTEAARKCGGQLNIIADEACGGVYSREFEDLCNELHRHVPDLRLWAAHVRYEDRPPLLKEVKLTEPLRSPPSITREIQLSEWMTRCGLVYGYTAPSCPPPTDGPVPRYLFHTGHGHGAGQYPRDCRQCGLDIAHLLKQDLHVGKTDRPSRSFQPALQFRDVFVLSWDTPSLTDGLVLGLRQGGVPVLVMKKENADDVVDVATSARDVVVVADWNAVCGLERKVVVTLQEAADTGGAGRQWTDELFARLAAMSRCSGQLVVVTPPSPACRTKDTRQSTPACEVLPRPVARLQDQPASPLGVSKVISVPQISNEREGDQHSAELDREF